MLFIIVCINLSLFVYNRLLFKGLKLLTSSVSVSTRADPIFLVTPAGCRQTDSGQGEFMCLTPILERPSDMCSGLRLQRRRRSTLSLSQSTHTHIQLVIHRGPRTQTHTHGLLWASLPPCLKHTAAVTWADGNESSLTLCPSVIQILCSALSTLEEPTVNTHTNTHTHRVIL